MSYIFIISLILILSIIQTVAGVGVLLIGTPVLLLNGFNIIDTINILLPFSIFTSLLNLIFFTINKNSNRIVKEKNIIKIFFVYCLPGLLIGTIAIQLLNSILNFKIIISLLILLSVILKNRYKELLIKINNKIKIFFITMIGAVHGLTNTGGSLLSIFVLSFGKNKNVLSSRYNITFFYFFLALVQYILFKAVFYDQNIFFFKNYLLLFVTVVIGCIIGNFISKTINKKIFDLIVDFLATITAFSLLLK